MKFSKELLSNPVYNDTPLAFNPLLFERKTDAQDSEVIGPTGAITQPNGDILFRIYAPEAGTVTIRIGEADVDPERRIRRLRKSDDGFFEDLYPYDPSYAGPHFINVYIDGTRVLYPYITISWCQDRPVNWIEVPDPDTTYINVYDVPHGAISREIYWSEALKRWQRCLVYTPPGYQQSFERYPVLYLQHGATENETGWEFNGRVGYIMDNLIAWGEAKPFIIVMNDGMARNEEDNSPGAYKYLGFENSLLYSCIPFIDTTYRTIADRENRALAGLSMGSSMTMHFGMRHPEFFTSLGMFSSPLHFWRNLDSVVQKLEDKDFIESNFKLILRTVGDSEPMQYSNFITDEEALKKAGTSLLPIYHTIIYPGQNHEWGCWRRAFRDFAKIVFKD